MFLQNVFLSSVRVQRGSCSNVNLDKSHEMSCDVTTTINLSKEMKMFFTTCVECNCSYRMFEWKQIRFDFLQSFRLLSRFTVGNKFEEVVTIRVGFTFTDLLNRCKTFKSLKYLNLLLRLSTCFSSLLLLQIRICDYCLIQLR